MVNTLDKIIQGQKKKQIVDPLVKSKESFEAKHGVDVPDDMGKQEFEQLRSKTISGANERKATSDVLTTIAKTPIVEDYNLIKGQVGKLDAIYRASLAGDVKSKNAVDQILITTFNKVSDPTSVVRESEYERFGLNLSAVNRISSAVGKFMRGGTLNDAERSDLVIAAKIVANSVGEQYSEFMNTQYELTDYMGGNREMVSKVYQGHKDFDIFSHDKQKKQSYEFATEEEANAANLPSGTIIMVGGRKAKVK
jgi:hypothetical protein